MQLHWSISAVVAQAGTGKTDVVTAVLAERVRMLGVIIVFCTPTHGAKKPLCNVLQIDKRSVHTRHSLTFMKGATPMGARSIVVTHCRDNKWVHVLVDEAGMVDSEVLGDLCEILTIGGDSVTMSFVRDIQQLPPVNLGEPMPGRPVLGFRHGHRSMVSAFLARVGEVS